jgi:hypothetical protein
MPAGVGYDNGVTYYQLNQSTTNIPAAAAAAGPYVDGFFGVQGTMEYLIWRLNLTQSGGTAAVTTDISSLVSQFKLVINGDILYDWVSGIAPEDNSTLAGRFGYFLNQIGGRVLQVPQAAGGTTTDIYMAIPVGAVLSGPTPRFEVTVAYYSASLTMNSGTMSGLTGTSTYWARFNPNTQRSTRVVSATSFDHGASLQQQVVARVPQMPGGFTLDAISIQNASANADGYGDEGLRVLSLSQFSMPISLQRWASNELGNGIVYNNPATSTTAQTYAASRAGILSVPLYGLKAGDLTMIVDNGGSAATRLYHPVMSAPLTGVGAPAPRQTVASIGNVQKEIVARTEGSN